MFLLNFDITNSGSNDVRLVMFDKTCNPTLSKEVDCPISLLISSSSIFDLRSAIFNQNFEFSAYQVCSKYL